MVLAPEPLAHTTQFSLRRVLLPSLLDSMRLAITAVCCDLAVVVDLKALGKPHTLLECCSAALSTCLPSVPVKSTCGVDNRAMFETPQGKR